jgi:hypothetical protein
MLSLLPRILGEVQIIGKTVKELAVLLPILLIESPVVPQVCGPSKKTNIAIAGILGLFVGLYSLLQNTIWKENKHWLVSGSEPVGCSFKHRP